MRCDAGFVIGGAAAVQPAVALSGIEGRGIPLRRIAFGLHVVVGIEQHRRRTGRAGLVGDHRGGSAFGDDLHVGESGVAQQRRHRLCTAVHLGPAGRIGPHRLDAHQSLQVAAHLGQDFAYAPDQIAHRDS